MEFWITLEIYVVYDFCAGVYSLCDRPGISRGPYFAIATICSVSSLIFVSLKASYVFSGLNYNYGDAYGRTMEIALFLSSWILAIGHIVVAYRISCRERRKLLVYKIDIEAVSLFFLSFIILLHRFMINLVDLKNINDVIIIIIILYKYITEFSCLKLLSGGEEPSFMLRCEIWTFKLMGAYFCINRTKNSHHTFLTSFIF